MQAKKKLLDNPAQELKYPVQEETLITPNLVPKVLRNSLRKYVN